MSRILIALISVSLLAGCMNPAPITQPPAQVSLVSSFSKDRLAASTTTMVVRTHAKSEKKNTQGQEIIGAVCYLKSDELSARVVTPQAVILPKFKQRAKHENRGVPGSLAINCTANELEGRTIVTATDKQVAVATGGGLAAALITIAVTAAVASSSPWQFPAQTSVTLAK